MRTCGHPYACKPLHPISLRAMHQLNNSRSPRCQYAFLALRLLTLPDPAGHSGTEDATRSQSGQRCGSELNTNSNMAHLQSITQQRPACRPEAHFEESTTPDSLADSASTSDLYARQRQSALLLSQGSPSEQLTQQDNHSSGSCSAADSTATFSPALLGSCSDLIPLLCQSESLVNLMQFRWTLDARVQLRAGLEQSKGLWQRFLQEAQQLMQASASSRHGCVCSHTNSTAEHCSASASSSSTTGSAVNHAWHCRDACFASVNPNDKGEDMHIGLQHSRLNNTSNSASNHMTNSLSDSIRSGGGCGFGCKPAVMQELISGLRLQEKELESRLELALCSSPDTAAATAGAAVDAADSAVELLCNELDFNPLVAPAPTGGANGTAIEQEPTTAAAAAAATVLPSMTSPTPSLQTSLQSLHQRQDNLCQAGVCSTPNDTGSSTLRNEGTLGSSSSADAELKDPLQSSAANQDQQLQLLHQELHAVRIRLSRLQHARQRYFTAGAEQLLLAVLHSCWVTWAAGRLASDPAGSAGIRSAQAAAEDSSLEVSEEAKQEVGEQSIGSVVGSQAAHPEQQQSTHGRNHHTSRVEYPGSPMPAATAPISSNATSSGRANMMLDRLLSSAAWQPQQQQQHQLPEQKQAEQQRAESTDTIQASTTCPCSCTCNLVSLQQQNVLLQEQLESAQKQLEQQQEQQEQELLNLFEMQEQHTRNVFAEVEQAHAARSAALSADLDAARAELAVIKRQLALRSGSVAELASLSAVQLAELAGQVEQGLARIREAKVRCEAEQERCCPVCWARAKELVFGCGHQACETCSNRLQACPICRRLIAIRIKLY